MRLNVVFASWSIETWVAHSRNILDVEIGYRKVTPVRRRPDANSYTLHTIAQTFFPPFFDVSTFLRSLGPRGNLDQCGWMRKEGVRWGVYVCAGGGGGGTTPNVIFNILNKTRRKTRDLHTWRRHGAIWGKRQQASGPVESVTAQPQLRAETHTHSTGSRSPRYRKQHMWVVLCCRTCTGHAGEETQVNGI